MPSIPGVVRVSDQRQNRKSVRLSLPINSLPSAVRAEVNFALSFTASRSYGSSRGPFRRTVVAWGVCSRQKSRRSPAASNARTRRPLLSRKTPGTTGHPLRGRRQVLHAFPFTTE